MKAGAKEDCLFPVCNLIYGEPGKSLPPVKLYRSLLKSSSFLLLWLPEI